MSTHWFQLLLTASHTARRFCASPGLMTVPMAVAKAPWGARSRWKAPVRPGDTVEATITVAELNEARRRITLKTECRVAGKTVITGEALVMTTSKSAA